MSLRRSLSASTGFGSTNASGVTQKAKGDAALVSEQSGIHAGTGGLSIDVSGQTSLVGGLITSEAGEGRNSFSTGTLTVADIDTHSTWKAETYGVSIGTSGIMPTPPVKDSENKTGQALSAIGGNIPITITDPVHQMRDIGTIRRDTNNTNTSLPGLPDLENILREQYKTQADLQAAQATMAGLVGDIATDLYAKATTQAERDLWKEGGEGRALLHAIGAGILGGANGWEGAVKGALGGAVTTLMAPAIADLVKGMLKDSTLSDQDKQTLANMIGTTLSSAVGGAVGGGEGGSYGAANYQYNYLTHAQRVEEITQLAACEGNQECIQNIVVHYAGVSATQQSDLTGCLTIACVDAIVASLADSDATLGADYGQLLQYSGQAAEIALADKGLAVLQQTRLQTDIAYAYFTADYCERNPGVSCKRDGGLIYSFGQMLVEGGYGAIGTGAGVKPGSQGSPVEGTTGTVPKGFANLDDFTKFGSNIRDGLSRAGYENVEPILQGSAVTGQSYRTGQAFDVGRVSDFDIALASPELLQRAQSLGIGLRSSGTRTGPLSARDLQALGLGDLAKELGGQAGREVNFMIYGSSTAATSRAPSIVLPK